MTQISSPTQEEQDTATQNSGNDAAADVAETRSKPNQKTIISMCYLLQSSDPEFRLKAANARAGCITAINLPEGWVYKKQEDAEAIAKKWTQKGRIITVSPWVDERVSLIWQNPKSEEAKSAKKAISQDIARHRLNKEKDKIELECRTAGLNPGYLYSNASSVTNGLTEKERQIHAFYKPLWDKTFLDASPEERVVEELNIRHAVVHTSQTHFLMEVPHEIYHDQLDFVLESKQSFKDFYENKIVQCCDGKWRTKAEIWIKSADRREFLGITFDPTGKTEKRGYYNIWKGFAYSAVKGNCAKFKSHIMNVICCGNLRYYSYVWQWCSLLFQKPHEIPEVALLLKGLQGTGKGVFVKTLGKLLAKHFLHLDSTERLIGHFNSHMKNAVLVFADEAIWEGDKKSLGKLKAMISEELASIEQKGKDIITMKNYRHFIFASNEENPVHLDADDRRFFVLGVSAEHKEDHPYFEAIQRELDNGGYEALLYDLLNEDISNFNPRAMPVNIESFCIKLSGLKSHENYIYNALLEGCFDIGNAMPNNTWPEMVVKSSIYSDYKTWCLGQNIKPEDERIFGKAIDRLIPKATTPVLAPPPENLG